MSANEVAPHCLLSKPREGTLWRQAMTWAVQRPLVVLLPLLVAYAGIILIAARDTFQEDEGGYVSFAVNLSHGYYSPPAAVNLWWGPGYPMVLLPFIMLRLPWLAAKLLNALFLFGAVVYFYRTLALYMSHKKAVFFAFVLGAYPPQLREVYMLMTEPLATFLLANFAFHFCKLHQRNERSRLHLIVASGLIAYLALTKIFFGYVIPVVGVLLLGQYLCTRDIVVRNSLLVFVLALVMCVPYLAYTYSLTGKTFYWGTSGGMSLYWMSTPYTGELGDWYNWDRAQKVPEMEANHRDFFDRISGLDQVAQDDQFRAQAIYNVTHHPTKFLQNWVANMGRLLFSYPFSYTTQKLSTYFYLLPNMFVVVLAVLCVYPSYRGRRLIPYEIACLLLVGAVALGGSSLLSAYERQFHVLVPIVALWLALTLGRIVGIEIHERPAPEVVRTYRRP